MAAALRIQAVCCWALMQLLHRQFHKIIAILYRGIALHHHVCELHILLLNPLLKPRILPAKQLHLLGVRCSTLLLNVQHEPH